MAEGFSRISSRPTHLQATSARKWNTHTLQTLRITPTQMPAEKFFGCPLADLPDPQFSVPAFFDEVLTVELINDGGPDPTNIYTHDFFKMILSVSESHTKPTVDALAKAVMMNMGFQLLRKEKPMAEIVIQQQTYFTMSGDRVGARQDLALVDESRYLLCLFVQDKHLHRPDKISNLKWPHAQVVAHALGAYNTNINEARRYAHLNTSPEIAKRLHEGAFGMVIPVFSFIGSRPCFYLIPITAAFATAVAQGRVPPHPTKIFFCPAPGKVPYLGMMPTQQRTVILKMFEAFKRFVPTSFEELCRFDTIFAPHVPAPISPLFDSNVWTEVGAMLEKSQRQCTKKGLERIECTGYDNYFTGGSALGLHSPIGNMGADNDSDTDESTSFIG